MWTSLIFMFCFGIKVTYQRTLSEWDDLESYKSVDDIDSLIEFSKLKDSECQCNWRLFRHYEAKGCQVADKDACGCPLKFDCPNANEIEENDKVCHYKGIDYPPGAIINTSDSCESCRCTRGPRVRIVCSSIECLNSHIQLEPGCHFLYEDGQCCPTRVFCDHYQTLVNPHQNEQSSFTCEYEGKKYPLGAKMFSDIDPCETCICTEHWKLGNFTCQQQDCILEKYKAKLMDGCVPIYNDKTCCPVEFYCAPDDIIITEDKKNETSAERADSLCLFGGKHYEIGKSLSINQESSCITCTCQVPPDFTCLHQTCQPNPNEQNCHPYFTSNDCCPKYECLYGDEESGSDSNTDELPERESESDLSEDPCLEISCTDERSCVLYQISCENETCSPLPTCVKLNASCPTPQCASGCLVAEQDENRCPSCVCGEEIEKRAASIVSCSRPRCFGQNCIIVSDDQGCPTCSCSEPCAIPECPFDCNVLSVVEGECPKCICEGNSSAFCPTPICAHQGCRIGINENGCPTCICDRVLETIVNRELEMEGSHRNTHVANQHSLQQGQQQLQNTEFEDEIPVHNQQSADEYDGEITVMTRRAAQPESKANMEIAPEIMSKNHFKPLKRVTDRQHEP